MEGAGEVGMIQGDQPAQFARGWPGFSTETPQSQEEQGVCVCGGVTPHMRILTVIAMLPNSMFSELVPSGEERGLGSYGNSI